MNSCRIFLQVLLIFGLVLPVLFSERALAVERTVGSACEALLSFSREIPGPFVQAKNVPAELINKGGFDIREMPNYDPNAIYIGIAQGSHELNNGSYYLIAGSRRFLGRPLYEKPKVNKSTVATLGVIFKIPASREVVQSIEEQLESGTRPRAISCLHALCKLLTANDVYINGTKNKIRSEFVSMSLIQGKIAVQGQPVNREEIEVWQTHAGAIDNYIENAAMVDTAQVENLTGNIIGLTIAGTSASLGIALVSGASYLVYLGVN